MSFYINNNAINNKSASEQTYHEKKLRMEHPMLYGHTILGTIFSICKEKDLPWFYNNFTQLKYSFNMKMLVFENQLNINDTCPFLHVQSILYHEDYAKNHSFTSTIIDALNQEQYIFLFLDWFYILHIEQHFAHTTLITGYNLTRNTFLLYDNYDHGKFSSIEIDFETVEKAFYSAFTSSTGNVQDNDNSSAIYYLKTLAFYKYDDKIISEFDKSYFLEELDRYINAKPSKKYDEHEKFYNGFDCYKIFKEQFSEDNSILVTRRDYHLLYEHKYLMQKRIQFLLENSIISNTTVLKQAEELTANFLLIRNRYLRLCIRYGFEYPVNNNELLNMITTNVEKERKLLLALRNSLEKNE